MKYIITGSLGNISRPVTENLVHAGQDVTVISSNANKKEEIESLGAKAAIGSLSDLAFLKNAFKEAEIAYLMMPNDFTVTDYPAFQRQVADNYIEAIKESSITHIVLLSSIGAHLRKGAGPIDGLGYLEDQILTMPNVHAKFLRPSLFYSNLYSLAGMIQNAGIAGNNYGDTDQKLVLVHTSDIAIVATEHLLNPTFTGKTVSYISSDEKYPQEIATALGKALGKENTPWITFTDEQAREGMLGAGLPAGFAELYIQMGQVMKNGTLLEDYWKNRPEKLGKYKFEDFVKEFAEAFAEA
ncbi:NAD(P)H-binding protein [Dyadobacter arcticus]|uniref:Uncharacterized protein YbjT (DUF2867 family) n=1 Tax=Dyadobacter arcticus TaxID=1078754 RepID=A0ABX0UMY9_9BACT|nr:NAD(P)H-binding protein [Dyadobacter arcticus]NIJ53818.1 uncharacterized protein YbjT (DUF2867 family) [Dyadobacter arcticus]